MMLHELLVAAQSQPEAAGFILRGIKGVFVAIGSIIAAVVCAVIAGTKGRSAFVWGVLGLFFSILTLIVVIVIPSKKSWTRERCAARNRGSVQKKIHVLIPRTDAADGSRKQVAGTRLISSRSAHETSRCSTAPTPCPARSPLQSLAHSSLPASRCSIRSWTQLLIFGALLEGGTALRLSRLARLETREDTDHADP